MLKTGFNNIARLLAAGVLALALAASAFASVPKRPSPARLVNDLAGIFSASQRAELEATLVAFDDTTSNQITVVSVADLEGYDPNQYAVEIGLQWGVGNKQFNNGVVLLVKPKNSNGKGQVAIQVGYGLEGAIPDAYASRIINEILVPAFKENDYFGGVRKACEKLMGLASGEISVKREFEESPMRQLVPMIMLIFIIMIFVIFGRAGRGGGNNNGGSGGDRRVYIGPIETWYAVFGNSVLGGGGHHGGGSFGGGSFGGGGFGGFGGGSFGGGGASGSW